MTPTQRAAALRLIEFETLPRRLLDIACRVRVNECLFHDDEFVDDASHALKEAIDLLRELAAEPVQEPVGWLNEIDGEFEHSHKPWMDDDEEWVPLYAAPQQPMRCPEDGGACGAGGYCRPEQRKPLTDEEALAIIKSTPQEDVTQEGWIRRQRLSWVRAIERAHGITGEQK